MILSGLPNGSNKNETGFCLVKISKIKESFINLRSGQLKQSGSNNLSPLPLRVAAMADDTYEIIDGFKRFTAWKAAGWELIPVVIEPSGTVTEYKKKMLESNNTKRTLTAMDEADIVNSLYSEDNLTVPAISKLLEHKKDWVSKRLAMATKLSELVQKYVAEGKIGPSLANYLTAIDKINQDIILDVFSRHEFTYNDKAIFIQSYRIANEQERKELINNPGGVKKNSAVQMFSKAFYFLENTLEKANQELMELQSLNIPENMTDGEKRRLKALCYGLTLTMKETLSSFDKYVSENSEITVAKKSEIFQEKKSSDNENIINKQFEKVFETQQIQALNSTSCESKKEELFGYLSHVQVSEFLICTNDMEEKNDHTRSEKTVENRRHSRSDSGRGIESSFQWLQSTENKFMHPGFS